jgi:small subunit ribosomal protein S9
MEEFFTTWESRSMVTSPVKIAGLEGAVDVSAMTTGGGLMGQAEAVRLGISRALIELNPTYRKTLKKLGYLMRDPRAKERKKPGLRKARRAPQWSKR